MICERCGKPFWIESAKLADPFDELLCPKCLELSTPIDPEKRDPYAEAHGLESEYHNA